MDSKYYTENRTQGDSKPRPVILILGGACLALLYGALFISGNMRPVMPPLVAQESIEYWLYESPNQVAGNISLRYRQELDLLYRNNQRQLVWMDHYQLNDAGKALVRSLRHTASDEWKAYRYRISKLQNEIQRLSNQPKHAAAIDVMLSDAYIDYAQQVLNNELLPNTGETDHPSFKKVAAAPAGRVSSLDVISLLSQSLKQGKLFSLVSELVPQHKGYDRLTHELDRYQNIADSGWWYPLDIESELQVGDVHPQVPRLRWMLKQYGDLKASSLAWLLPEDETQPMNPAIYEQAYRESVNDPIYELDAEMVEAIKHFQLRNALPQSGQLDPKTLSRLNLSPYFMAQRIALNMKRWRYLPKTMSDKYILVNMANFRLDLINQGESEMNMKVIIGREQRRTPVLAETISTVVLAPIWNVPHRIAIRDILPAAKRDPSYLTRHNFKVYQGWQQPAVEVPLEDIDWEGFHSRQHTYRFVQASGDENSLGNVKFIFPNDKSIYLHDTNHKELFAREMRALSSGCIRVEKPLKLAHALLKSQNWDHSLIKNTIGNSQMRPIQLKAPMPVYLMYWTTWVDENGQLQIRDDVYKRDIINGESHKLDSIVL